MVLSVHALYGLQALRGARHHEEGVHKCGSRPEIHRNYEKCLMQAMHPFPGRLSSAKALRRSTNALRTLCMQG